LEQRIFPEPPPFTESAAPERVDARIKSPESRISIVAPESVCVFVVVIFAVVMFDVVEVNVVTVRDMTEPSATPASPNPVSDTVFAVGIVFEEED